MSSVKEIQSVRNACRVLEAIARTQPVGVIDVARAIGIDKSATHRLAITLHAARWLDRTEDGRWSIAPTLISTIRESGTVSLVRSVRPLLEAARDHTGETAMLVVPEAGRLMIIDVVESRHNLRVSATVGAEMPARRSSALRALAAHLPADELATWRRIDPELTDRALEAIRGRGWALNDGEVIPGTGAVGAALRRADGLPVASFVLCGPSSRFSRERLPELGDLVARLAATWPGCATNDTQRPTRDSIT
jgi:IclR family transcriptional regulator, acetate operon repressor